MPLQVNRRRFLGGVAFTTAASLGAPWIARAATVRRTVRIGTVNPSASATGQACKAFADAVAASPTLSPVLQVEVIAGGALGGELEMTQACINGSLDLAVTATNVVASIVPELGLLDAPFLFRDAAHARSVLDGPVGAEYTELLKAKGANNLAWAENGLRHVTGNRPVRRPEDLHGLHIRVPQSQVMIDAFKALGASPEPLPFPQLFDALRTGQFEAEENPVATIVAANFQQVQKYLSLTGHVYSAAFFIVSPDLFEDLEPAQRSALVDAARIGGKASRDTASQGERDGIVTLGQAGMTIVQDVDRAALAEAPRPVLDAVANRLGADRAARIRNAGA
jgi:tripartite ATP-independent transporter DctP family solute receptor